ncbi:DUF397 domain-containing protein [Streptomyces sp. HUAS 31]|nr:DUF397 domain-containing protein [Streptomyces sp. HUAS 31]WCD97700.1 DUF397 domain-containing protein [Streptomyces sp. HUAS 31]
MAGPRPDSASSVARSGRGHVRDSKHHHTSPRLALAPQAWAAFVTYASER